MSQTDTPNWCDEVDTGDLHLYFHAASAFDFTLKTERYLALMPFGAGVIDLGLGDAELGRTRLRANSVTWLPPMTALRMRYVEPVEFLIITAEPKLVHGLPEGLEAVSGWHEQIGTGLRDPGITALAHELRRACLADQPRHLVYVREVARVLLVRLNCSLLGKLDSPPPREALSPGLLARLLGQIDADLEKRVSVTALADMAGLSRSHFTRAFQRMTGDPPQRFILKRRVALARRLLLETNDSVARISARAGFASQAHLASVFQREMGMSPTAYRRDFGG